MLKYKLILSFHVFLGLFQILILVNIPHYLSTQYNNNDDA
jgi:hypothetical protein